MKKIISLSLCLAVMLLCACTQVVKSPQIKNSFSQKATITIGDYSYTANVKFDGSKVYITPTSTNAKGMTISCDASTVTFTRRDMVNTAEKSKVSPYNPAVIIYDVITSSSASVPKKEGGNYTFSGKTSVGDYTLMMNESSDLLSLQIPTADFYVEFVVNS